MQTVSINLLNSLRASTKSLMTVVEFYHQDAVPAIEGFDPNSNDCLLRVASVAGVTFKGATYQRLLTNIGRINKIISKTLSGLSVTLSNSTREIIDFEEFYGFEGLICVVREFDRNFTNNFDDSIVHFTGRCEAPDEFTKSSETARINVKQILNQTETVIPRRKFTTADLVGRSSAGLEFEGFIYAPRSGSINYTEKVRRGGLLGLFGLKKTVTRTMPYSSHSDLKEETSVPVILGRVQAELINFASEDKGTWINFIGFWADGHEFGIKNITNIRAVTDGYSISSLATKLGRKGGLVDDANFQANDDPNWIGGGIYSRTAYSRAVALGTPVESDDPAPTTVGFILGQVLYVVNSSGQFATLDVSDNAVAQSRWIISSEYYLGLGPTWLDDESDLEAYQYNEHILLDKENTDTVLLNNNQTLLAGTAYNLYKSTGSISPNYYKANSGLISFGKAYQQEVDYQFYDNPPYTSDDWLGDGEPVLPPTTFRRRFTSNVQLREEMKVLDFLFDILLPSSNLYLVQKANGKIAHKNKKPVSFTFVKSANLVNANQIHVQNINPWVGKNSLILIGANFNNSEVRRVTNTQFDLSVNIAISASGGVSASSGTLGNGSNSVAPNSTLTVSNATGLKTINLAGFTLEYSPKADDTNISVAGMIAGIINSHNELNKFIKATWTPNTATVLVQSRIGFLTLDANLEYAHQTFIANPAFAVGLAALSNGNLLAGKYQLCYSFVSLEGETLTSPITEIVLSANQSIQTPTIALPNRVLAVKWYCSTEVNGVRRKLVNINNGASFLIDVLPKLDDQLEPVFNSTAEEIHHIDLAFTDKANTRTGLNRSNMLKGSFSFPKGGKNSSINQIKIKFRDASADYRSTTLIVNDYVKQAKTKKKNTLEINGAAIDNEHQARRIANARLAELSDGNRFFGLSSDGEALLLEEGDIICVTDESGRFVNEPCRIEEISIDSGNGFSTSSFVARKYRRYYYDDQIQERLVPLPIVQNYAVNQEQNKPILYIAETPINTNIKIGVRAYSVSPNFRKIQYSANSNFSANLEIIQSSLNEVGQILPEFANIVRMTNLLTAETIYVRAAHSSNGQTFGEWSDTVSATYPAPPTPSPNLPPTITDASYANGKTTVTFNPGDGTGLYTTEYNLSNAGWIEIQNNLPANSAVFEHTIAQTSVEQNIQYRLKRNDLNLYSTPFATTIPAQNSTPPSGNPPTDLGGVVYYGGLVVLNWNNNGGTSLNEIILNGSVIGQVGATVDSYQTYMVFGENVFQVQNADGSTKAWDYFYTGNDF